MKLSIVIAVYNGEKYIDRGLRSALTAIDGVEGGAEILAINNNSSDNSLTMLEKYAKEYPDVVRVMTCETPGLAAVRNFGMTNARGEYVWYVDVDDEVTPGSAARLLETATKADADITTLQLTKVYPDGHREQTIPVRASDPEFRSKFIRAELGPMQVLIRRKWFLGHGFKFAEGRIHEDMELMSALMLHTDKYASADGELYLYYQNPGSILHPTKWDKKYYDIFPAMEGIYKRFAEMDAVEEFHAELEWLFIWNLLMDSGECFRQFPEGRGGFSRSRRMLKRYFPQWRRNKFLRNANLRTRLKIYRNFLGI